MAKKWFEVLVTTEKIIKIFAYDEEEAQEKAEIKMGATWSAEDAWEAN
jgi:hypothetical protein